MAVRNKIGSIDVRVIEIVLEIVEEISVGKLVVDVDDALAEYLEWVYVVYVHRHRRSLLLHVGEEVHLHRSHLSLSASRKWPDFFSAA